MRILLDTNILIHREAAKVVKETVGILFNWLDRLGHEKCVHPISSDEISKHADEKVRKSFEVKLKSYVQLKGTTDLAPIVAELSTELDRTVNDRNDTAFINELYLGRVDLLISEDRGISTKADRLGMADRVYTIDEYLEKVTAENPELADYNVLSVRKEAFGNIDVKDSFFDSFREDYPDFDRWFLRKSEEDVYVCYEGGKIVAFLYLKTESEREPYPNIHPPFASKRRLKIGTFKVELNGYKIGERFLKIIFDNAIRQRVEEIYVTIYLTSVERERLAKLLMDYGFTRYGEKQNSVGNEDVYVRDMSQAYYAPNPKLTFPYVSRTARAFVVPIYPDYHTELLPDSILNNESPENFIEHGPHRNSIRKVYVSRSIFRSLQPGDTILFYRTGGHYKGVVTTLGIVDKVHLNIQDEDQFLRLCRKRSVFTNKELRQHWNYKSSSRPFVVEFLYAYSFPKRPNLAKLREANVIQNAPRGFEQISENQLSQVLSLSQTEAGFIVD